MQSPNQKWLMIQKSHQLKNKNWNSYVYLHELYLWLCEETTSIIHVCNWKYMADENKERVGCATAHNVKLGIH